MLRRGGGLFVALLLAIGLLFIIRHLLGVTEPPPTSTPSSASVPPTLQPPAEGEIMVMVTQFEPVRNPIPRDVSRFITADLKRNLEQTDTFSKVRIRQYEGMVTTSEEAQKVAKDNRAAIIIWGNYTPDYVTANVEIGSLDKFENNKLEHGVLERSFNIQARMTDEQSQSLASITLLDVAALQMADSNLYETMFNLTSHSLLQVDNAEIMGNTVSANAQRAYLGYLTDNNAALTNISAAIKLDPTNAFLLLLRSWLNFRSGNNTEAATDLRTASRLAPDSWITPTYMRFMYDYAYGNYQVSMENTNKVIAAQPEQWYPYYMRAMEYFSLNDFDNAQSDLDRALALNPTTNFPYLLKIYLELRAGNVTNSLKLYGDTRRKFPDFSFGIRFIEVISGVNVPKIIKGDFDVLSNILLERYDDVIAGATTMLDANVIRPEFYVGRAFAECNQDDYTKAEADLTAAEKLDNKNFILYLLRAEVRLHLKNLIGAAQDTSKAQSLSSDPNLKFIMQSALSGKLSCKNYFDLVIPTVRFTESATP